ncbi:signal peptidase I [Virgibacillus pantothenticus]|uniref:Signal peptidase I n=1 Tax=Virgibacillus pantothenticus TaxID=1473 RepID=A0A0L0QP75_VIRPA|nr:MULTISPECIES: signal peptidase I [Virgibacillus]API93726.1 signal peptidase I [Virgibacillus sp. 6R]KNE20013.1 signal peptidase [Virgibacillus pantothenticus]MBS7429863.1 signal peptidase I [Virgibacillus sp. 19R1-5]MBU8565042.1 signal peptidase I [Virgibacillus pantothenticus]MBU8599349.1 signal peptidase I [Virgibacillus pantothenticus]
MSSVTKSNKKKEWLEWAKAIIIAVLIAIFLKTFIFATSIVDGESMDPTLQSGERVIFNKIIYILDEPERGDIVIIEKPHKNYVKRVIGLPGETIEINDGNLYINGKRYDQTFLSENAQRQSGNYGPEKVPEGSYFVMGDNRAISKDSRNGLGFIEEDEIIGRSEFVIFPFDQWTLTR